MAGQAGLGVTEQESLELPGGQASAPGTHFLQLGSGLVPWDTNRSDKFLGSRVLDFQESQLLESRGNQAWVEGGPFQNLLHLAPCPPSH